MLSAPEGGRNSLIQIDTDTRYMPHLAIDDRVNRIAKADTNGQSIEHVMGVLFGPVRGTPNGTRETPAGGFGLTWFRLTPASGLLIDSRPGGRFGLVPGESDCS